MDREQKLVRVVLRRFLGIGEKRVAMPVDQIDSYLSAAGAPAALGGAEQPKNAPDFMTREAVEAGRAPHPRPVPHAAGIRPSEEASGPSSAPGLTRRTDRGAA